MFRNYLISAFRGLLKSPGYASIHIIGLAVGLTASVFVIHYALLENNYDAFHKEAQRIYRVATCRVKDGVDITRFASTYAGVSPAIKAEYPEVESSTRLFKRFRGGIVSYGTTRFHETNILHVDSGFFKVFSFRMQSGNPSEIFAPGIAFIESVTARKYFGTENPIGKRISFGSVDGVEDYEIRGVIECPENSSIKFSFLFSYHNLGRIFGVDHISNWTWLDFHTFIKLKEGIDHKRIEERFPALLKKFRGDRASGSKLFLQALPELYLTSKTEFETGITGNKSRVNILLTLGVLIIGIAWLNFVNLSTSQALTRVKEVGIRKTLGSSRLNLVIQFLVETGLLHAAAIMVSVGMIWSLLPVFNELTGRNLLFTNLTGKLWEYFAAFLFFGLLIGTYPAFQLSVFNPIQVLKGFFAPRSYGALLREGFVFLQSLVSFSMIVSVLIVIDQIDFLSQKDLGIDIQRTLVVKTPEVVGNTSNYYSALDSYKGDLKKSSQVLAVAMSADCPGIAVAWIGGTRKTSTNPNESHSFYRAIIDESFLETMGLKLITGKNFSKNQPRKDILLNQTGAQLLGFEKLDEAVGQKIIAGSDTCTVIGVIENYHQVTPGAMISPTLYHYNLETPRYFFIKFEGSANEVITTARNEFVKHFPSELFDYYFLDAFYDEQYADERKLASIITLFSALAILVSSLGLLGLTWFRLSRQKKEMAIRKVIGSTQTQLFVNALRQLFKTTIIGCLAGVPATWYIMNLWLENFSIHTEPKTWEFVMAFVCSLVIAVATVSGYTLKIVRANSIQYLRQE